MPSSPKQTVPMLDSIVEGTPKQGSGSTVAHDTDSPQDEPGSASHGSASPDGDDDESSVRSKGDSGRGDSGRSLSKSGRIRQSGRSTPRERKSAREDPNRQGGKRRGQMMSADQLDHADGGNGAEKNQNIKRRRSYDSTLFGLDVFEGLQVDYEAKRNRMEGQHWLLHYVPVIMPTWKFQQVRDLVSVFVILYSVYTSAFELVFTPDNPLSGEYLSILILDTLSTSYFWIDLLLQFTSAYYDEEEDIVMDRRKIAKEYLRWWFWIDFVSNLDVAGAMSLLKMLRLARFPRLFVRWANLGVSTMALNLFKISILTLTAGHFLACAFFAVADHEKHTDDNWTRKDFGEYTLFEEVEVSCNGTIPGSDAGFDITSPQGVCLEVQVQQNLLTVYIASLYFAYATLTTVGYGDIAATTTSERAIALVALTVGSAIFAGIVGMMSQLLETMDELEELKLKKLKHIQQFIKSHHFPDATKDRIRRYYDLHFLYLKKELDMLNELSPALRHECMHHIYARILEKVPFLRDSPQIIQSTVIASVTPILCCEKDYLVIEGQVLNHMFLVASGAVEVINNKGLVVRTYGVGSFFGEKCAFHAHYLSAVSYRAKVDLEVLTIERAVFVDILNTYEEFAETFVMICQKREEHKKGGDGSSKMTSKLAKSAESMVRPVTPPPGTTWKKPINGSVHENQHRETSFYSKDDEKRRSRSGPHVSEFFEDNSVPALLDKLQYNLTMQIDEVMDHLEDVEDRLDEMEDGEESDEDIWGGDSSAARDAMLVGQNSLLEIQKQIGEEEGGGGGETPPPPTGVGGGVGGESAFVGVIPGQMEFTETEEDTKCLSLEEAAKAAESSVRKSPKPMGRRITSSPPRAAVKRASGISTEQSTVPELQRFESRRKQRMERKTHDKSTKQIRHERRESNRFRKLHSERHLNGGSPHEF